jgi:hypothetical protein
MGIDDLYHGELGILIVEFLRKAVRFNILKIKPGLIPNAEAGGWRCQFANSSCCCAVAIAACAPILCLA